jgi:hypothetical protein
MGMAVSPPWVDDPFALLAEHGEPLSSPEGALELIVALATLSPTGPPN